MGRLNSQAFIYVFHAQGTPRVKLGVTRNIEGRRRGLQTGCPYKLVLLAKWLCPPSIEKRLHSHFAAYRREGEWFELPPFSGLEILKLIKDYQNSGAGAQPIKPVRRKAKKHGWLKDALPHTQSGSWWEVSVERGGYRIKLRWRYNGRKIPYCFAKVKSTYADTLRHVRLPDRRRLVAGHLFREIKQRNRPDIAKLVFYSETAS